MEVSQRRAESVSDMTEKVINVNRVAKVVKGGRRFSFSALVVVGDGKGKIGVGLGKAGEVPEAIKKGTEQAKKNIKKISLAGTTIPHIVLGRYGAGKVLLRPASEGTGCIAGGVVRAILEAAGIHDVLSKSIGSKNPHNVVRATLSGLGSLRTKEEYSARIARNTSLEEKAT
jgi:small subunit ribosomal protein S5